jgi:hypothetical protein
VQDRVGVIEYSWNLTLFLHDRNYLVPRNASLQLMHTVEAVQVLRRKHHYGRIRPILGMIHLADNTFAGKEPVAVNDHFDTTGLERRYESFPDPLALVVAVADKYRTHCLGVVR